jgi:hypothetical protein
MYTFKCKKLVSKHAQVGSKECTLRTKGNIMCLVHNFQNVQQSSLYTKCTIQHTAWCLMQKEEWGVGLQQPTKTFLSSEKVVCRHTVTEVSGGHMGLRQSELYVTIRVIPPFLYAAFCSTCCTTIQTQPNDFPSVCTSEESLCFKFW